MDDSDKSQQLGKAHTKIRLIASLIWLTFTLSFALGGVITWLVTRNIEHLYGCLFYAIFPLIGLIYTHFILFNPKRDPLETERRAEALIEKYQKNARSTAKTNGAMLLFFFPFILIIGVADAIDEYGDIAGIIGVLLFIAWIFCVVRFIKWWRRSRSTESNSES